ncbi:MAG: efflux RND transporter periplasmic adaptor subunit [Phenylobacterium sp.]|nr:efflux RND transporter periplasmic adaptor subunit [Phenylobacterium sp.]
MVINAKTRRLLTYGLGLLMLIAAVIAIKLVFFPAKPEARYATAPARMGDLEQTVLASGVLEPLELVSVGAQVSGRIEELAVDVGDVVQAGQLIAQIDNMTQQNDLRDRQAALVNVRAQRASRVAALTQANLEFTRQRQMLEADATPRAEYEAAQATLAATKAEIAGIDAQIQQAQASVDSAQVNLGYTRITAPISGTVVAVVADEGQTVNANQSAPTIVMIAKLNVMTVRAEISEADVVRVKPGQPVYFTVLGDAERRYHATLRMVEPAPASIANTTSTTSGTTAEAVYYNGLFDVPNVDGTLRPSMTAQVNIVLARARNALTIPATALGRRARDGSYTVQVVDEDGEATPRKIKVGINTGVDVQVLSGLKAGEQVVIGDASATTPRGGRGSGGGRGGMGGMGGGMGGGGGRGPR